MTAWQLLVAAVVCAPVPAIAALEGHSSLGAVDPEHVLAAVATGLLGSADSVEAIAGQVGYTSEFAFNRAFSRPRGQPPGRYRRLARAA